MRPATMKWFRLYVELLDDPKVQLLSDKEFRTLINTWCAYAKNEGTLPDIRSLAFSFRSTEPSTRALIEKLKALGFLDETATDGILEPHGWRNRQYVSDVSTGRVQQFRKQRREVRDETKRNVSLVLPETTLQPPQIQSTDTEADTEEPPLPPLGAEVFALSATVPSNGTKPCDHVSYWFESVFWPLYPRKVSKDKALDWCRDHGKSASVRQQIMDGLAVWNVEFRSRETKGIPYPKSFLNGGDWKEKNWPQERVEQPRRQLSKIEQWAEKI